MSNEQGKFSVFGVNNSTLIPFPDSYNTMHFGGDSKTYRELVYTSRVKDTLNLTIEILTNDSETSRLALRNDRKKIKGEQIKIPRPQNAYIIYRRDKFVSPEFEGMKSCIASKTIGRNWKTESNEVHEYFGALSMLALENHQKKYGNYKYKPKSKASKKFKNRQKQQSKKNTSQETTLNQDLSQLVVNPPSSTKEYPTPLSSIQNSPVTDFSEQANENSYLMTPASSNHQSPVTSQYGSSDILTPESINQQTPITSDLSLMNYIPISMYPQLSDIIPTNDFSTYNNALSEYVLKFLNDAYNLAFQSSTNVTYNTDILATPTSDMTSNNMTFGVDIAPDNTDINDMTFDDDMAFDDDILATDMDFGVDIAPGNTDIQATQAPAMTFNDMTFDDGINDMAFDDDILATPTPTSDSKIIFNPTTNTNDQIEDFDLYPYNEESEGLIPNITPPAAGPMTASMKNQILRELFGYDSHVDQFGYYENNNGLSF